MPLLLTVGGRAGQSAPNNPSPIVDTQAPFTPPVRTVAGIGYLDHTIYPVADHPDIADADSGVKEYDRIIGGVTDVVTATAANIHTRPTILGVNGATTTGSFNGRTLTLRSDGTGLNWDSTSDQFGIAYWDLSDFKTFTIRLNSVTTISGTPNTYGNVGIVIRGGSAADAVFVQLNYFLSAVNRGGEVKYRPTIAAQRSQYATFDGDGSYGTLVIEKSGTNYLFWRVSNAGAWTLLTTQTIPWLTGTLRIGAVVCPVAAGATIEASMDVWYTDDAPYTTRQTTAVQSTFKARARDVLLNVSPDSVLLTTTPLPDNGPSTFIKHSPGLEPQMDALIAKAWDNATWDAIRAWALNKVGLGNVTSLSLICPYGVLTDHASPTTFNDCDAIINTRILPLAQECNIPIGMHLWPRKFTGAALPSTPQSTSIPFFPDWALDAGYVAAAIPAVFAPQQLKLWIPQVNQYYINLYLHILGLIDNSKWIPYLETEESSDNTEWPGYDQDQRHNSWKALFNAVLGATQHTLFASCLNFYNPFNQTGVNRMIELFEIGLASGKFRVAAPDLYVNSPNNASWGEMIWRGANFDSNNERFFGGKDYRGRMACGIHNEMRSNDTTTEALISYSKSLQQTSFVWRVVEAGAYDTDYPNSNLGWSSHARSVLTADPNLTVKTCPSSYGGLCSFQGGTP